MEFHRSTKWTCGRHMDTLTPITSQFIHSSEKWFKNSNILGTSHSASIYWVPTAVFITSQAKTVSAALITLRSLFFSSYIGLDLRNKEDRGGSPPKFTFMWNNSENGSSAIFKNKSGQKEKKKKNGRRELKVTLLPCLDPNFFMIFFSVATVLGN